MTLRCIAALAFGFVVAPCIADQSFAGHWSGTARVDNIWANGKTFRVAIDIHRDGSVSGTLGGATLTNARFRRWRPPGVGRKQSGDMMDYMITGKLTGSIIPAEHISASNIFIALDVANDTFDGGVNAHDSVRGKQKMGILSCDLILRRER